MKIMHVCLAAFYIDNYGYQENILPKMHKKLGYEVRILASTETYLNGNKKSYINASRYLNEDNIEVTRIPYIQLINSFLSRKLRLYKGIKENLVRFQPDIIFLHDIQFLGIYSVINYLKKNPNTVVFADGHADFTNSATNWLSRNFLHRLIYKRCAQSIEPFTTKFYGTLPCRVDFFKNFYGINEKKISLLQMGVDDTLIHPETDELRRILLKKHDLKTTDFIIISGGKIDEKKNIHNLITSVAKLNRSNVKLFIFGKIESILSKKIELELKHPSIIQLGWLNNTDIHNYLQFANLAVFPGKHSVLWEQTAGLGTPAIYLDIEGHHHIKRKKNCLLIPKGSEEEIKKTILKIIDNKDFYNQMKQDAMEERNFFSYTRIAKSAINLQ